MILYLGNKLSAHGATPTGVETLGPLLADLYPLHSVSEIRTPVWRLLDMLRTIIARRNEIQCLLIDTYGSAAFHYAWISAQLARWMKIPYIPILRGGRLPERLESTPRLSRLLFADAAALVAPSAFMAERFGQYGDSVVTIPNSIALERYPFRSRRRVRPRLLYVRAMEWPYNPLMAVRVLQRLARRYDDACLCMVGPDKDGTAEKVLREVEKLGLSTRFEWTGRLSKEEWIALSREYDIFINTSDYDNTPVSLIEAMALGLPVVSTEAGGISRLVEDGSDALTVPVGDAEAMSDKITELVEHPERSYALTNRARRKAEAFDWEQIRHQWRELLERRCGIGGGA